MKKFYIGLMTLVILLVVSVGMVAWADVPDKMSFEGRLTDTSDNPITTSTTLQFGIHSAASGGTQVWTSGSYTVTPDTNGVFHVVLGSQSDAINPDIFDAPVRYIEVIVEGERLTPRAEIVSVGYAFKADDAQTLMGNTVAQIISMSRAYDDITIGLNANSSLEVKDGGISGTQLAGDIDITTTGSISATSVVGTHYGDGSNLTGISTTANDFGRSGVATSLFEGTTTLEAKYVNQAGDTMSGILNMGGNTITNVASPTADSQVATKAYVDAGGGSGDITGVTAGTGLSGGGVTGNVTLNVANDGITSGLIAASAVSTSEIASGAVSTEKISNEAVTEPKLDAQDSPAGGEVLSWNAGTSRFEWIAAPGTGTVTQVNTGTGLTGGPIVASGTISIDATVLTTSTTAGGDLSGTYPNPAVDALQGRPVSAAAPNASDVLTWSGAQWAPAATGAGDITGVATGPGLVGGGTSGTVTLEVGTGAITSTMIQDGTIAGGDLATNIDITTTGSISATSVVGTHYGDGSNLTGILTSASDFGRSGVTTSLFEGTTTLEAKYVNQSGDTMTGNLQVPILEVDNANTYIDRDGGPNMTFTDPVTGTKTLAELAASGAGDITEVTAGPGLSGGGTTGAVTLEVATDGIISAMIATGAVSTSEIAAGAVSTEKISNEAVTEPKLDAQDTPAGGEVLSWNAGTSRFEWIAAPGTGTVTQVNTGAGLTGGPITTTGTVSIASGGIDSTMLATGSVTSGAITDGTITGTDLSGSIDITTSGSISATSVVGTHYGDGSNLTGILTTANDFGRSGVSATLYEGTTSLEAKYVQQSGDTMTGILDLGGNKITSVGTPTAASDAATKAYVDATAGGDITSVTASTGLAGGGTSGAVTLEVAAGGITAPLLATGAVTSGAIADGTITSTDLAADAAVLSLAEAGSLRLTGDVDFVAGSNVTITQTGQTLEVAATAGGGDITEVTASTGLAGGGTTGAVTLEVATGGITASMLATGSVTSGAIADGTITGTDLSGTIDITTTGSISATSVVGTHYGDGSNLTGILTTANDFGRSGVSATLYEGTTSLEAKYVQQSGDTMTGILDLGGNKITSVGTPTAASDAATKAYVDATAGGDITSVTASTGLAGGGTSGAVTLEVAAGGITAPLLATGAVTSGAIADGTITSTDLASDAAVLSIAEAGSARLTGNVDFVAGSNVTISQTGQTLEVASTAGGGDITEVTASTGLAGGGTSGAVTLEVAAGGITTSMLATGSVTSGAISDGTITGDDLAGDINITTTGSISATSVVGTHYGDGSNLTGILTTANDFGRSGVSATLYEGTTSLEAKYVQQSGDTMTGILDLGGNKITSVGTPTAASDAATKAYVDATAGGDITEVTAGTGLSGGGTTGAVTLEVAYDDLTIGLTGTSSLEVKDGGITSIKIADGTIVGGDLNSTININTTGIVTAAAFYGDGSNLTGITTTGADFGRSGVATALYEGTTTLEAKYVNQAGDTMTGDLRIEGDLTVTGTIDSSSPVKVVGGLNVQTGTLEVASGETKLNNVTYSWPGSDGSNGDALTTDGSGILSWTSSGAGDITAVDATGGLSGGGESGRVTLEVASGGITASMLATGSVTSGAIANNTITGDDLTGDINITTTGSISATSVVGTHYGDGSNLTGILTTANDFGRSGVSTTLYEGTTSLEAKYVELAGDTMTGDLIIDADLTVTGTIDGGSPVKVVGGLNVQTGTLEVASDTRFNTVTYTWPSTQGIMDQVLANDGSGQLSWSTVESSASGWTDDGTDVRLTTITDNVGIGTNEPTGVLQVTRNQDSFTDIVFTNKDAGASAGVRMLLQNDVSQGGVGAISSNFPSSTMANRILLLSENSMDGLRLIAQDPSGDIVFDTGGALTDRMIIDSSGRVGIGTMEPAALLSVAGTIETTAGGVKFPDGTTQLTAATSGGDITAVDAGDGLSGGGETGRVTLEVADGGITAYMLAAGSVTSGAIANNTITGDDLAGDINITTTGSISATSLVGTHYGDGSNLSGVPMTPAGSDGQVQYNNSGILGGATNLYYDDATGLVGVGTSDAEANLTVQGTFEVRDLSHISLFTISQSGKINLGDTSSTSYYDDNIWRLGSAPLASSPIFTTRTAWGNFDSSYTLSSISANRLYGAVVAQPSVSDTTPGSNSGLAGLMASPRSNAAGGTFPLLSGVYFKGRVVNASGTVTDVAALIMEDAEATGTITNQYGVKIPSLEAGTNNYGIYVQNASTYPIWVDDGTSRFDGNVMVGTITPSSMLTVGGTIETTAGGVKFPDGTTQLTAASGGGDITAVDATDGLSGGGESGRVTLEVADGGITSIKIQDGTIAGQDLAGAINILTSGLIFRQTNEADAAFIGVSNQSTDANAGALVLAQNASGVNAVMGVLSPTAANFANFVVVSAGTDTDTSVEALAFNIERQGAVNKPIYFVQNAEAGEPPRMMIGTNGNVAVRPTSLSYVPASSLEVVGTFGVSGTTTFNNVAYTWPAADGSADYVLKTNGSGILTWESGSGTGDITSVTAGTGLSGGGTTGDVTLEVADGGITASMLATGSVTSGAIANNTITGDDLAGDINITTSGSIAAGSLVGTHYGDGSNLSSVPMTPAGSDGQVQYNDGGALGGASDLSYSDTTGFVGIGIGSTAATAQLTVANSLEVTGASATLNVGNYFALASGISYLGTSLTYNNTGYQLHISERSGSGTPIFGVYTTSFANFYSSYYLNNLGSDGTMHGSYLSEPASYDTTPGNTSLVSYMAAPKYYAASGTLPLMAGVYFRGVATPGASSVTDVAALIMEDALVNVTATITNQYGVKIPNLTAATNDYGIYVAGADTYPIWIDSGTSRFDGNVMIGTITPSSMLTVAGTIETTAGGYKFPDGTTQLTAATGGSGDITAVDAGDGLSGGGESGRVTLEVASGGITAAMLATGSVTSGAIADGTITGDDLAGDINIITTGSISATSVVGTHYGDGSNLTDVPVSAAGSNGFVQFNDAGALGANADLFWHISNKRLGVGTTEPERFIHVKSDPADDTAYVRIEGTGNAAGNEAGLELFAGPNAPASVFYYRGSAYKGKTFVDTDDRFKIDVAGQNRLVIDTSGNVGIGTPEPQSILNIVQNQDSPTFAILSNTNTAATSLAMYRLINAQSAGGIGITSSNFPISTYANRVIVGAESGMSGVLIAAEDSAGNIILNTGGQADSYERMRITSVGRVGIGSSEPGSILTVAGTVETTAGGYKFPDGTIQTTAATGGTGDITAVDAGDGLSGGGESGRVTLEVADGGITAAMLGSGVVTSGAIANNTITGDDLANNINITTTGSIAATTFAGGVFYGDGSNLANVPGNTLGGAYNEGGSGEGRVIQTYSEAVVIQYPASATGSTGALVVDVDKSLDDSEMAVLIYSDTDQSHGAGNSGALLAVSQNNVSTSDPAIQVSHYGDGSGITVFKTNNLGVQEVGIGVLTVGSLNDSNRVLMGAWSDNGDMSWGTIPSTLLGVMNEGTNLSLAVFDQASDPTPFVVDASGNVGVGTATPEAELHVVGDIKVTGTIEGASPVNVIGGIYLQTGTLEVASGETRLNTITYSWPGSDGSNGDVLATDGSGTLSWTSGGSGDISAVGSMTSGEVFANASADGQWLGLGASAGRIEFNDQVTDEVNIMNARVGIGTTEPNALLVVHGGAISHDNANNLYGSNAATHVNLGIGSTTGVNGENNSYCTIGGGYNNMAKYNYGFIGGGQNNVVSASNGVVGGGADNTAGNTYSGVVGGSSNNADGYFSFIGGGYHNTSSGQYSVVPGGQRNTSAGDYSWAGGRYMQLSSAADRTFVWGYSDSAVSITRPDAFIVYSGDVGVGTTEPDSKLTVAGTIETTVGGYKFPDGTIQTTAGISGGNTLDQAYDQGGAGVGRNIIADAGAVTITGNDALDIIGRLDVNPSADNMVANFETDGGNYVRIDKDGGLTVMSSYESGPTLQLYNNLPELEIHIMDDEWVGNLTFYNSSGSPLGGMTAIAPSFSLVPALQNDVVITAADDIKFGPEVGGVPPINVTIKNEGSVGIGTTEPSSLLTVVGTIETKLGGVKFPDGTIQTTAATGGSGDITAVDAGLGLTGGGESGRVTLEVDTAANFTWTGVNTFESEFYVQGGTNEVVLQVTYDGSESLVEVLGDGLIAIDRSGNDAVEIAPEEHRVILYNNSTERIILDGLNGTVGIRTDEAISPLSVYGTIETQLGGVKFPDGTIQVTASTGSGGNTLDQAYDQGGAGQGRTIEADSGAVTIDGSNAADETLKVLTSANGGALFVENTGSGNSLRVNDSNPDTTPFIIDENGYVGIGTTEVYDDNDWRLHLEADLDELAGMYLNNPNAGTSAMMQIRFANDDGHTGSVFSMSSNLAGLPLAQNAFGINSFDHHNLLLAAIGTGMIGFSVDGASANLVIVGDGATEGYVGVGSAEPASLLTVAGTIETTLGGVKFPDGSIQTTATSGGGDITSVTAGAGLSGGGTTGDVTLEVASGGITAAMLATDSVTSGAIADGTIIGDDLASDINIVTTGVVSASAVYGNVSIPMTAGAGGVTVGDILIIDTSADNQVVRTTAAGSPLVIGFALNTASAGNAVQVAVAGKITNATASGIISRGDAIRTSTTAGRVEGVAPFTGGTIIGQALTNSTVGNPVTVWIHKM